MQARLQIIRARALPQLQLFRAGNRVDCKHGRFRMQATTNSALAAIAGFDANLLLAAQSIANLEAPDDKRLDGKALAHEFEVNMPIKFVYRAADERTAEWAENLSGTQWLDVAQRENVKANVDGGEQWEGTRTIAVLEHAIISRNTPLLICRRASASSTCPTAIRQRFSRARPRSIAALRHGKPSRPAPNRRRYRPRESEVVLCSVLG